MKYLKYLPLLAVIMLASCKLDPAQLHYTNVVIPIDERSIPSASLPGESFSIYAHATLENGCWSNIRFYFDTLDERNFQLFALADYSSIGACPEVLVTSDTAISLVADEPGTYIIRTWLNAYEFELDSVRVTDVIK